MRLFASKFLGISALLLLLGTPFASAQGIIHVAAKVRIRTYSGVVTAVSGNSITISLGSKSYTVDASAAKIIRKFGAAMAISDIQTNDQLAIKGTLNGTVITAKEIRDLSLQAKQGTFRGKVLSLGTNSFMIQSSERGQQTINTDSSTVFKKNGQTGSFADLYVGVGVVVSGVWDRTNSNVTAKQVDITIKELSIKVKGTLGAVSGNTLTVNGSDKNTYTVDISKARLLRKFSGKSNIAEFKTGDSLQITGKHLENSTAINAQLVRDLSITANRTQGQSGSTSQQ